MVAHRAHLRSLGANHDMAAVGALPNAIPIAGLATANTTFTNTVSISAEVGETSASSTAFFLLTDEQAMDVTISVLDADDNVLYTTTVEDVPFKRNRKTKLTGKLYSAESAGSFLLNKDWIDMVQHSF